MGRILLTLTYIDRIEKSIDRLKKPLQHFLKNFASGKVTVTRNRLILLSASTIH
jgi:hypothetical protein